MGMWCALDDWEPDPVAEPYCAFLPGKAVPLMWTEQGPRTVSLADEIGSTWRRVALAAHWATAHPDQLHAFVGDFELYPGMWRIAQDSSPV
jgi:hypothetical protein